MKNWRNKVIEEKQALDNKLKRLMVFQETNEFKNLEVDKIKWLNRQRMVMELYSDILAERIKLVEIEDA